MFVADRFPTNTNLVLPNLPKSNHPLRNMSAPPTKEPTEAMRRQIPTKEPQSPSSVMHVNCAPTQIAMIPEALLRPPMVSPLGTLSWTLSFLVGLTAVVCLNLAVLRRHDTDLMAMRSETESTIASMTRLHHDTTILAAELHADHTMLRANINDNAVANRDATLGANVHSNAIADFHESTRARSESFAHERQLTELISGVGPSKPPGDQAWTGGALVCLSRGEEATTTLLADQEGGPAEEGMVEEDEIEIIDMDEIPKASVEKAPNAISGGSTHPPPRITPVVCTPDGLCDQPVHRMMADMAGCNEAREAAARQGFDPLQHLHMGARVHASLRRRHACRERLAAKLSVKPPWLDFLVV